MELLARIAGLAQPPYALASSADARPGTRPPDAVRRLASWLVTHLATATVDVEIAVGADPDTDPRRALRASALVDPRYRANLASHWQDLLARAGSAPLPREPRVPIPRRRVLAARGEISALVGALLAAGPVPARGVAMARRLLLDADGPLYGRSNAAALRAAARDAVHHLDPALPLYPGEQIS